MKPYFFKCAALAVFLLASSIVEAQRYKEQINFEATGDQTISLGRYYIGTAIRIECHISGGWATDGGIYHIVADWGGTNLADPFYHKARILAKGGDLSEAKDLIKEAKTYFSDGYYHQRPYVEVLEQIYLMDIAAVEREIISLSGKSAS